MAAPNLPALKLFLDIDGTSYDAELPTYLQAAQATISQRCGPVVPSAVTEQIRVVGCRAVLTQWPLVELTSMTDDDGNSVDITAAKLDKDAGIVYNLPRDCGLFEFEYDAGYNPTPDDLELAVYIVAGHLWDTQRGRGGAFSQIHGLDDDAPVGGDASFFVMQGYALPRRAMELTRPYTKAGFR